MAGIKNILRETKTRYLQAFESKPVSIRLDRPLISITFDDVPVSAMKYGVPILEGFDARATFYVAMGLAMQRDYISPEEIVALKHDGHDIACHTYSHYELKNGSAESIDADARRNVRELCELLGETSIDHFSYPFGQVNISAKRVLGKSYKSMRSSRPGINEGLVDMNLLRAKSVYSTTFDRNAIQSDIYNVERSKGWLIFYTHGVTESPDDFSCTPNQFEWLLTQCKLSRADILPVADAYRRIMDE